MKIALVAPQLPPKCSGVGDHAYRLGQALERLGHDVLLITEGEPSATGAIRVHTVGKRWSLPAAISAGRAIKAFQSDAVVMEYTPFHFGVASTAPVVIAAWARIAGIPLATFVHEAFYAYDSIAVRGRVKAAVLSARDALVCAFSRTVFVANEIKKAQIVRRVPTVATRLQVVPIGANIEPAEGVTWHPRSGGRQTLLAFGIVMPRRRIELLIAMLKELVAGGIDADLCVAGRIQNSAYAAQCLQMANELGIADRVTFTGTLAPETVTELFLRSSLSLHAAEEGLISSSGALLAAFAHGVPVVGARTQTDEAMLLQATLPALSDARDIARVVTSALDDTASRVRAGTLGRQLYRGQFEWAHIAELTARSFNLNQKVTYAAGL